MLHPGHDVIVVGGSAGGVEAAQALAAGLPRDLKASVFVVIHLSPSGTSVLPEILDRAGPLRAVAARDGERILPGVIYVASPDVHLLVGAGHLHVVRGPKENLWRPAVDPLFRSAALAYGPRVVGVVLTGLLDDGAAGLYDVKLRGGIAVVQDPVDCAFPSMPLNALRVVKTPHVVPLRGIAPLLARLSRTPVRERKMGPVPSRLELETKIASLEANTVSALETLGRPSRYACPECFGPLWRLDGAKPERFRCHAGHAFGHESLLEGQEAVTETGLWRVLQSAEERIVLMRELAGKARKDRLHRFASRWEKEIRRLERLTGAMKRALSSGSPGRVKDAGRGELRGGRPRRRPGR